MSLPAEIYAVEAVRAIDRAAIDEAGISGYKLMTRAAEAALQHARETFPDASRWQVVCGAGNNAGDGYVLARLAAGQGITVSAVAVTSPASLAGDAATAYGDFEADGGMAMEWQGELDADADLLVEALLGSGLDRHVGGAFADAVTAINNHAAPVVALDIPAGIHGDSGAALGVAVRADLTVTFVGLKTGLFVADGQHHAGVVKFADLGIPAECRKAVPIEMRRIDDGAVNAALPPRRNDAH